MWNTASSMDSLRPHSLFISSATIASADLGWFAMLASALTLCIRLEWLPEHFEPLLLRPEIARRIQFFECGSAGALVPMVVEETSRTERNSTKG